MQELIVKTAQITSPVEEGWKKNGVGYHYNLKFGFGRLDARRMVEAAKNWKHVGPHRKCITGSSDKKQYVNMIVFTFNKKINCSPEMTYGHA